ncbi:MULTISPECIES: hypothetical protein [unclassified Variovorax]|uniref:hypothetical protein n=1 Tax=unclassified Variovorax TaxID=663243 RepID=UPI003ECE68A8
MPAIFLDAHPNVVVDEPFDRSADPHDVSFLNSRLLTRRNLRRLCGVFPETQFRFKELAHVGWCAA